MPGLVEEYVTDVPYVRAFASDLSPLLLRLVAAINGFAPPPGDDFEYCELGSAHGDTTATLAAAYPKARFLGVDIIAEHVATAQRLARAGALENVGFLQRDFEQLLEEDLPELDFVTAHGVLSWVGPTKRKAVFDFAASKLKRGGLVYVSYNALPGWAALEPLRHLIRDRADAVDGTSLDRAREAVAFAKRLRDSGAMYFANNVAASDMLGTMEKAGLAYVVHEYLHAHWTPMYFTQVAAEMAASGLYFVGQLPLHANFRDLAVPASYASVVAGVHDRVTFESLKDYGTNCFFRRDVFIKGDVLPEPYAASAFLESTPFGTLMGEGALGEDVRLPHQTLQFRGPLYDALFEAFESGAKSVADVLRAPALSSFGTVRVREAVVRLAIARQVSPMMAATRAAPLPPGALHVVSPYNRAILRERFSPDHATVLASEVAGTGVILPLLEGVLMRLLTEVPQEERWPAWLRAFAHRQPFRLRIGTETVESDEDRVRVLLEQIPSFREKRLPRYVELGIVASKT